MTPVEPSAVAIVAYPRVIAVAEIQVNLVPDPVTVTDVFEVVIVPMGRGFTNCAKEPSKANGLPPIPLIQQFLFMSAKLTRLAEGKAG